MAKPSGRSINLGSDQVPDNYCESCFDFNSSIKPVAGYCIDCAENLCIECYNGHLLPKPSRNHRLVDKSMRPKLKIPPQQQPKETGEKCQRHHGKCLQYFCKSHSQICCKVCLTLDHNACNTEEIAKMSKNISSVEIKNLVRKLSILKKGFNENLNKTDTNRSIIKKKYSEAIDEMKKLRDEFDKLMSETKKRMENVKVEDLKNVESVTETCNIVIEQITKMTSSLDMLQKKGFNEKVFISMQRAEIEFQSMEKSITKLNSDNTVRQYKFEPDAKLRVLLSELEVLGHLSSLPSSQTDDSEIKDVSILQQMAKTPTYVKDITVSSKNLFRHGSVMLPNKQMLITDYHNQKVKLIDTNTDITVMEIQLSDSPMSITKVNTDQFAVLILSPKIQMFTLAQNLLSLGREILVTGNCWGIDYNPKDKTFIVSFHNPGKVQIINMTGTVVRTIETDSKGSKLFIGPMEVVLSPDLSGMYVSDYGNDSVTLLTVHGDVKNVYKDNRLKYPAGICVHKSGMVYVVSYYSHKVHQLDPGSGMLQLLLDQEDGLRSPWSISYCDIEDKLYVGMQLSPDVKVFRMN